MMGKAWLIAAGLAGVAAFAPLVTVAGGGAPISPLLYLWRRSLGGNQVPGAALNVGEVDTLGERSAEAVLLA